MTRRSSPVSNAMPGDMRTVSCDLTPEIFRRFEAAVVRYGTSKSVTMRRLIIDYLNGLSVAEGALPASEPASKQPG